MFIFWNSDVYQGVDCLNMYSAAASVSELSPATLPQLHQMMEYS